VKQEPWVQELLEALARFDIDQDNVLSRAELLEFTKKVGGEAYAEETAEFIMKTGPEADPQYLEADGIFVEGIVQFYMHASIGRAWDVRNDLQTLKITTSVPDRNSETPETKPVLGRKYVPHFASLVIDPSASSGQVSSAWSRRPATSPSSQFMCTQGVLDPD
jgi:hypothetical protein